MSWKRLLFAFILVLQSCAFCKIRPSTTSALNGKHLKIYYYEIPGILFSTSKDKNGSKLMNGGFIPGILHELATSLNFTYSFIEADLKHLSLHIIFGADMIVNPMNQLPERAKYADFTQTILFDQMVLLQAMPKMEGRIFAAIKPFQPMTWLVLVILLLAVAFVLYFLTIASTKDTNGQKLRILVTNLTYVFQMIINQGIGFHSYKGTLRIVAAAWCIASFLIGFFYSSELISSLTVSKSEPIVNTWEELATGHRKQILVPRNSVLREEIMSSSSEVFMRLKESLDRNPSHSFDDYDDMMRVLLSGCCAYPAVFTLAAVVIDESSKNTGECHLTTGKTMDTMMFRFSFLLPKDSPYTEAMNEKIERLWEGGILNHLIGKHQSSPTTKKCSSMRESGSNLRPSYTALTIYDLSSAWIVLALGILLSIFAFLLERIIEISKWK